jgi:hypothetical protein
MIGSPLQWDQNLAAAQTYGRRQLPFRIAGELRSLQKDRFWEEISAYFRAQRG